MLAPLLFTKLLGRCGRKEVKYSRHFTLDFRIFMAVPYENYNLSMKDK